MTKTFVGTAPNSTPHDKKTAVRVVNCGGWWEARAPGAIPRLRMAGRSQDIDSLVAALGNHGIVRMTLEL